MDEKKDHHKTFPNPSFACPLSITSLHSRYQYLSYIHANTKLISLVCMNVYCFHQKQIDVIQAMYKPFRIDTTTPTPGPEFRAMYKPFRIDTPLQPQARYIYNICTSFLPSWEKRKTVPYWWKYTTVSRISSVLQRHRSTAFV